MLARITLTGILAATGAVLALLLAIGWMTRVDPTDKPYLRVIGGGFVFNYRIAEVYYGFTAIVDRPLLPGSVIEASFEDPGGGPAHVARLRVDSDTNRYALRSPPVRGVVKGRPYAVSVKVMDREEKQVIWSEELVFRSQLDDTVVPDQPLTIGPGYARNPER